MGKNPYDRGCLKNYLRLCCEERRPPSELPVMHEKVSEYEYRRLRDSFTGFPSNNRSVDGGSSGAIWKRA